MLEEVFEMLGEVGINYLSTVVKATVLYGVDVANGSASAKRHSTGEHQRGTDTGGVWGCKMNRLNVPIRIC